MVSDEKAAASKRPSMFLKTTGAMVGGCVEACALQPLDVVKTRLQLEGGSVGSVVRGLSSEGISSFYKGLSPFVAHLVTKYAVVRSHFLNCP